MIDDNEFEVGGRENHYFVNNGHLKLNLGFLFMEPSVITFSSILIYCVEI